MIDATTAALCGVAVGSIPSLLALIVNNRSALHLERVKLNDVHRRIAYKALFKFASRLHQEIFPLAEDKETALRSALHRHFDELDFAQYGDRVNAILDELEEAYICENHPDLRPEGLISKAFYEDQLPKLVEELYSLARREMRQRV